MQHVRLYGCVTHYCTHRPFSRRLSVFVSFFIYVLRVLFPQLWLLDCFAFGCKSRNSILCITGIHFACVLEVFTLLSMSSRLWGESRYAWSGVYGDIYIPDGHRCRPEWYDGSTVSEDATLQTGGWDLQTNRPGWINVWMKQGDLVNA